jgi:hypothetical protein
MKHFLAEGVKICQLTPDLTVLTSNFRAFSPLHVLSPWPTTFGESKIYEGQNFLTSSCITDVNSKLFKQSYEG